MVLQVEKASAQKDAKYLHKLVSKRGEARRQLADLQQERACFESSWCTYTQELMETLTLQFAQREQALTDMDQREQEWTTQLVEASRELEAAAHNKNHSKNEEGGSEEEISDQDMTIAAAAETDAKAMARRAELAQSHQRLQAALQEVKDAAEAGAMVRERTPRRGSKRTGEGIVDLTVDSPETQKPAQPGATASQSTENAAAAARAQNFQKA